VYTESQLLPISALQHLVFCERQCALIHVERLWAENWLTAEGQVMHKRAHDGPTEVRGAVRIVRGVALRSLELGLAGQADVVEFERIALTTPGSEVADAAASPPSSTATQQAGPNKPPSGRRLFETVRREPYHWRVTPVEYKRGKPKKDHSDAVQLAAQAICLEEMLEVTIPVAWLFYGKRKRRTEVALDDDLRAETVSVARRLHEIVAGRITPPARYEQKCDSCSLKSICLPEVTAHDGEASRFFSRRLAESLRAVEPRSDPFDIAAGDLLPTSE